MFFSSANLARLLVASIVARVQTGLLRAALSGLPGVAVFVVDRDLLVMACGGEILERHPNWDPVLIEGKRIPDVLRSQPTDPDDVRRVIDGYKRALQGTRHKVVHSGEARFVTRFHPVVYGGQIVAARAVTYLAEDDPVPVHLEIDQ